LFYGDPIFFAQVVNVAEDFFCGVAGIKSDGILASRMGVCIDQNDFIVGGFHSEP